MTEGFRRVMTELGHEYASAHEFRNRLLIQIFAGKKP